MVFCSGMMMVNGKVTSISLAKRRVRRYARLIQRLGWAVSISKVKVVTVSASFKLNCPIELTKVCRYYSGTYDPELFPAVMFTKDSIHFTCFHSGTVLMTGIKRECQLNYICIPVLIEIPLL